MHPRRLISSLVDRASRRCSAVLGINDQRRWARSSIDDSWGIERYRKLAAWIPPGSRVIELGAGNGRLEAILPRGCEYFPTDIVKRKPHYMIADLNKRPLPVLPDADTVVMAGVLEYVRYPDDVFTWLQGKYRQVLLSYATCEGELASMSVRAGHGWISNLTQQQLMDLVEAGNWRIANQDRWANQILLHLAPVESSAAL